MDDSPLLLSTGALLLGLGTLAGLIAGRFGAGGGIVLVPAFFNAFTPAEYDSPQLKQMCLGTPLATITVTSTRSALSHNRRGAVDLDILRCRGSGIVTGAVAWVALASNLKTPVLRAIIGSQGIWLGICMMSGAENWRLGDRLPDGPARIARSPIAQSPMSKFLSVPTGRCCRIFGVPGPSLFSVPIHRAVGPGLIIAVLSFAGFLLITLPEGGIPPLTNRAANLVTFALVITMTLIAAPMGAALAQRNGAGKRKQVSGGFLRLVALNMPRMVLW